VKKFAFYIALGLLLWTSCREETPYIHLSGNALGTHFSIKYKGQSNYHTAVDSLFNRINASLSTYHSNSLISRINRNDSLVLTDTHFEKVYQKALRIYKETGGYFDPSVGILVNAWGFGPKKPENKPDSSRIKQLMQSVGFDKIQLKYHKITKENPGIYIDFNAIAKGYTVDVIGRFLESKGIGDYMVEIGGEIRARGKNPDNTYWSIGIEKPVPDASRALDTIIHIQNQSVATSGNYRKFKIDKKGHKYVHTINPKTGFTEQNDVLSASIITSLDCADADAYATACMVMGLQKSKVFIKSHPELHAILIYLDTEKKMRIFDSAK